MGFAWVSEAYSVLPRAANPSLNAPKSLFTYFTLGLRGRRSKEEGVGNLGARQRLREEPEIPLPFPSNACHAGYVTLKADFH